jgi:ABC-2 type transport system permease protein
MSRKRRTVPREAVMAVYERTYRRYTGPLTPERTRFLTLPRYAYREVFQSKLFVAFFVLACLPALVDAVIIYLHHNLSALGRLQIPLDRLLPIDAYFFRDFVVGAQSALAFFLALFVGPGLVSADLRNNALPLYLSRPFSRQEYVLGKLAVLLILLSAITWVPGLLLFFLEGYLEGFGWIGKNVQIGWAIFASSWAWILVLSLLTLAISAWVKWKPVARLALLVLFFVLRGWGAAIDGVLRTHWGGLISIMQLNDTVRSALFGVPPMDEGPPVWSAWIALLAMGLLSLALLARRVKPFEVVR